MDMYIFVFPHLCIDTGDSNEMPTPRIGKKKVRIKYTEILYNQNI